MSFQYHPPKPAKWSGRQSANREYIHERLDFLDLDQSAEKLEVAGTPVILGYACDEGVRRNQGRPGAAAGPEAFRQALGGMPWHRTDSGIVDAGDFSIQTGDLEACQQAFSTAVARILELGGLPICIGGGHDMAYAHFEGLRQGIRPGDTLGIVNFDAHLDLRLPDPKPHSGSPFLQIAQKCQQRGEAFRYACLGLRRDANPSELVHRARDLEVWTLQRDAMGATAQEADRIRFARFLEGLDRVYLSIDLDGFASAFAPGVSAASPMGFSPADCLPWLDAVLSSGKLLGADLAELNPQYDRDGQTARLAASLAHRILHFEDYSSQDV